MYTSLIKLMHAYVRLLEKLLDTGAVGVRREKMYKLDDHVACAVAGITGVLKPCIPTLLGLCSSWTCRHFCLQWKHGI